MKKLLLTLCIMMLPLNAHAFVLAGDFTNWEQNTAISFGDGEHDINVGWDFMYSRLSSLGDFWSDNAFIYRVDNWDDDLGADPEEFIAYKDGSTSWNDNFSANYLSGEVVLYNGYYAQLFIDDLVSYYPPTQEAYINGHWLFQTDGSTSFNEPSLNVGRPALDTPVVTPEPSTFLLLLTGVLGMFIKKEYV